MLGKKLEISEIPLFLRIITVLQELLKTLGLFLLAHAYMYAHRHGATSLVANGLLSQPPSFLSPLVSPSLPLHFYPTTRHPLPSSSLPFSFHPIFSLIQSP